VRKRVDFGARRHILTGVGTIVPRHQTGGILTTPSVSPRSPARLNGVGCGVPRALSRS
jgi:hypothetical protein